MSSDQNVPLRDFLSGLMYTRAEAVFQRALDPFVKRVMLDHFGEGGEHRAMLERQQRVDIERAEMADRIRACLESRSSMDLQVHEHSAERKGYMHACVHSMLTIM